MAEAFSSLVDAFRNVGVSRAYGGPVQLGGEEIIPVALVSFGFGGGSAPASDGAPAGAGGGGGGFVLPLGVYVPGRGGGTVFRPNPIAVLMGLVPLVCAVGLSLRGILHGRR